MKTLVSVIIVITIVCSCGTGNSNDEIMDFIPGTYVMESTGEFGKSYDTLILSLQNEPAKQYSIERRWRYDRVIDGKPLEPEYKTKTTTAIYNPEKKFLEETQTLVLLTFDVKNKTMNRGTVQFTKIK